MKTKSQVEAALQKIATTTADLIDEMAVSRATGECAPELKDAVGHAITAINLLRWLLDDGQAAGEMDVVDYLASKDRASEMSDFLAPFRMCNRQ